MSREQILQAALALAPEERVALASELFDSLASDEPDATNAWDEQIARRMTELERGAVQTRSGEEVFLALGRSLRPR